MYDVATLLRSQQSTLYFLEHAVVWNIVGCRQTHTQNCENAFVRHYWRYSHGSCTESGVVPDFLDALWLNEVLVGFTNGHLDTIPFSVCHKIVCRNQINFVISVHHGNAKGKETLKCLSQSWCERKVGYSLRSFPSSYVSRSEILHLICGPLSSVPISCDSVTLSLCWYSTGPRVSPSRASLIAMRMGWQDWMIFMMTVTRVLRVMVCCVQYMCVCETYVNFALRSALKDNTILLKYIRLYL